MLRTETVELFSFRRCPYAMRARMALYCSETPFTVIEVSLRQKPARLLELSPKGTVPVLVADGQVIDQSLDIMHWALQQSDPAGWLHRSGQAVPAALLQCNDQAFKHWLDRYKYPNRYPDESTLGLLARDKAVAALLTPLAQYLSEHAYLGGQAPALEDVAIFPFVRQFAAVEPEWFQETMPAGLQRWLSHWVTHPLFERVMQKPQQQGG